MAVDLRRGRVTALGVGIPHFVVSSDPRTYGEEGPPSELLLARVLLPTGGTP